MSSLMDKCFDNDQQAKRIPCEQYSRVVGYFAKVSGWNRGKKEEWRNRRPADVATTLKKAGL